jgi:hypothetical protein
MLDYRPDARSSDSSRPRRGDVALGAPALEDWLHDKGAAIMNPGTEPSELLVRLAMALLLGVALTSLLAAFRI